MRENIDSCHKESEIHAAYPEQSTAHFEEVVKITFNSASVITQEKQNGSQEHHQANTYNENEVNKSIEEKASEKIEQTARN